MRNEHTNRALKAIAIAEALKAAGCDAETAENLDDTGWQLAAKVAAANTGATWTDASWETRSIVIAILSGVPEEVVTDTAERQATDDALTNRTCSTCGAPATASWHDAGPFGAGTFYGCDEHTPADVTAERAAAGAHAVVDDDGASLYGSCSHCQRRVDNHDDKHRVTPIMRGGRGVECVLRGDIAPHDAAPLGPRPVLTVRAVQSSGAARPGRTDDERALAAAVDQAIARQHHGGDLGPFPEEDDAYINWCAAQGDLDPEDALTRAMYADHLDASEREAMHP